MPSPLLAAAPQVDNTSKFKVGNWVRIWAAAPLNPAAAKQAAAPVRRAPAGSRRLAQALGAAGSRGGPGGSSKGAPLELPQLVAENLQYASAVVSEAEARAEDSGPAAASAPGTLDAHLYGENALDSGSGGLRGLHCCRSCAARLHGAACCWNVSRSGGCALQVD